MSTKHTPGPYYGAQLMIWAKRPDGSDPIVAECKPQGGATGVDVATANRNLFAAVLDLLEAAKASAGVRQDGRCESCNCELSMDGYCGCAPLKDDVENERLCKLRAAIAKAEGREGQP